MCFYQALLAEQALPLHIWARDQGYNRIQANLLGM